MIGFKERSRKLPQKLWIISRNEIKHLSHEVLVSVTPYNKKNAFPLSYLTRKNLHLKMLSMLLRFQVAGLYYGVRLGEISKNSSDSQQNLTCSSNCAIDSSSTTSTQSELHVLEFNFKYTHPSLISEFSKQEKKRPGTPKIEVTFYYKFLY